MVCEFQILTLEISRVLQIRKKFAVYPKIIQLEGAERFR